MNSLPFSSDASYTWIIIILLTFTLTRYILLPVISYLLFYVWGIKYFKKYKIQNSLPSHNQIRREIKFSVSTIIIFTLTGTLVYCLYKNGYTTIYTRVNDYSWLYFFISIALMIIVHDTYFYWTHRLLHTRWLFKRIHRIHHQSFNPTPLTA